MGIFEAIILSLVEGLTEFLPVSSTGHLILTSHFLNLPQTEFLKTFEIAIQLGAILAVIVPYGKTVMRNTSLMYKLLISFLPTGVVGLLAYKLIKEVFLENVLLTVSMLFLGGILFLFVDKLFQKNNKQALEDLTVKQALIIGLCQSVSVIPGVSRAGATILGGLSQGFSRKEAVEYSFLLAVPTMAAATGYDLLKSELSFTSYEYLLLGIGCVGAFITAYIAIKTFIGYVQNHSFIVFGVYRIILSVIYFLLFFR